jgi:hypothetical protein
MIPPANEWANELAHAMASALRLQKAIEVAFQAGVLSRADAKHMRESNGKAQASIRACAGTADTVRA